MIPETKIVRVEPSDLVIERTTRQNAVFGWELVNNQRCSEHVEGAETTTVSVYNKLTFQRPKGGSWHSELVNLETKYEELQEQQKGWETLGNENVQNYINQVIASQPARPHFNIALMLFGLLLAIVPGVLYVVYFSYKQAIYEKLMKTWKPLTADLYVENIQNTLKEYETQARALRQ